MRKKLTYIFLGIFALLLIAANYVAYNHAYNFTHYSNVDEDSLKVRDESKVSFRKKLNYIFSGVAVPRPKNSGKPYFYYDTNWVHTPKGKIEIWEHEELIPKGTVIMFHGYANKKSSLIARAEQFINMGYSVILVDFLGSGGSDGSYVTIGYEEADQVKYCYDFAVKEGYSNIYLFGISMGAVSIMKCQKDHQLAVSGIILECPFGKMRKTLKNRFKSFGVPSFPMLDLLMLWGSYHAGYWTYSHNPQEYAKYIECPTLLMHGNWDQGVSKEETDAIYNNLKGKKTLKRFLFTGHDIFVGKNRHEWKTSVNEFMVQNSVPQKNIDLNDVDLTGFIMGKIETTEHEHINYNSAKGQIIK